MIITSRVRKAVPDDAPELMDICRELHAENGLFSMNEQRVSMMLQKAFRNEGALIGALGPTGAIEGAIFMLISQYWYTDDWCLEELFNYVRPQYRRSSNAKELIGFGKRCSDELGIPLVIGVISNERTKAKVGLYQRQLADPVGAYFVHRPASAGHQLARQAAG